MEARAADMPCPREDVLERTKGCRQRFIDSAPAATDIVGAEWFESRQAEFNLWSRTMSAASQGKSSLDYRLRNHAELRRLFCNLLDGLAEALDDLFKPSHPEFSSDRSPDNRDSNLKLDVEMRSIHSDEFMSEGEDSTESDLDHSPEGQSREDSIEIPKFYVKTTISQLFRLSAMIKRSGAKYRYMKADAALKEDDFEEATRFWVNDILGRRIRPDHAFGFPEIIANSKYLDENLLSVVQNRLVKANLLRLNRIEFARKRRATRQANPSSSKDQTELQPPQQQRPPQQQLIAPSIQHTATTVGSTMAVPSSTRLRDSSVVSQATRIGTRSDLDYPKCPEPLKDAAGQELSQMVCPYCADLVPTTHHKNSTSWRKHVAEDILPYVCFHEQCETPDIMYATSEEVMKHVNQCHSRLQWVCTQCITETKGTNHLKFTNLPSWEVHTRQQHDKSLTSAELALLADACKETIPNSTLCPLCMQDTNTSMGDVNDHILWHLHQFALNCLPWDKEDDDWESNRDMQTVDNQELRENEELLDGEGTIHGDWEPPDIKPENDVLVDRTPWLSSPSRHSPSAEDPLPDRVPNPRSASPIRANAVFLRFMSDTSSIPDRLLNPPPPPPPDTRPHT